MRTPGSILIVAFMAAAAGCTAGSGEGLDISGRPVGEGGDLPLAPTLASIQVNVFDPFCIVCHAGAAAPQGLRLDATNSFTNLVGVRSREVSSLFRVSPGKPDESYLIHKLEGTASVGDRMPLGGPPVPQGTIDFVRQWIIDGALPATSVAGPGAPPVAVSMVPLAGQTVAGFPEWLTVGFDQPIDASTVNRLTIELVASGGDGTFEDGNEVHIVPARVSLSDVNPRLAVVDLRAVAPLADEIRVTVRGSGASVVSNVRGTALQGDYTAYFAARPGRETP